MQQHPIPQHVTGYKFHLVGNMTLKQFSELAVGLVIAWIIFSSNIFFLLKWTLGPLAGMLGFALAFMPIEDRPLDQWIINFIKSIYSPSQFIYKSTPKTLDIFSPPKPIEKNEGVSKSQPNQLQDYLDSLPQSQNTIFDQSEKKYLDHIKSLFGALGVSSSQKKDNKVSLAPTVNSTIQGVRIRKLHHPKMCLLPRATAPVKKTTVAAIQPKQKKASANSLKKVTTKPTDPIPSAPKVKPVVVPSPKISPLKVAKPLPILKTKPTSPATPASFADDVILPQHPEKPNLISGITLDKAGKIIPNVIIEIRDSKNLPVRALKANKLGQFFIATPLSDGVYQISSEHPDQSFDIIKLEAKGEIIPPIKIQAK